MLTAYVNAAMRKASYGGILAKLLPSSSWRAAGSAGIVEKYDTLD